MKSSNIRIMLYFLLLSSFLITEIILVKYLNFEVGQISPVIGILSMCITFPIIIFEALSLVKFIKVNYIRELEKILPKKYKNYSHTSRWVIWFAFSKYDFEKEKVKSRKDIFIVAEILFLFYHFAAAPITYVGLLFYESFPS